MDAECGPQYSLCPSDTMETQAFLDQGQLSALWGVLGFSRVMAAKP